MKKKRWALKLALCLLAGAVVTWGVAWGCATWSPMRTSSDPEVWVGFGTRVEQPDQLTGQLAVGIRHCAGWPFRALSCDYVDFRPRWAITLPIVAPLQSQPAMVIDVTPDTDDAALGGALAEILAGRPTTMTAPLTRWFTARDRQVTAANGWVSYPGFQTGVLPCRPMPLGFLTNTLICALIFAFIVGGVRNTVRWARARRGSCPSCGYDRGGLAEGAACPECGGKA